MRTTIYVAGPAGAGKSTLCALLAQSGARYRHISLDEEVKRLAHAGDFRDFIRVEADWARFWRYCAQALASMDMAGPVDEICLIDAGAGALQTAEGRQFFMSRAACLVCVLAEARVARARCSRKFGYPVDWAAYRYHEFSPERKALYSAAARRIHTTYDTPEISARKLGEAIDTLVTARGRERM